MESFLKNRNFDKARFYFKKIIHDKSHFLSVRIKAYEKLSFSYKLQRNKEAYAQNLRKAVKWLKNILIKKKYKTKEVEAFIHEMIDLLDESSLRDYLLDPEFRASYPNSEMANILFPEGKIIQIKDENQETDFYAPFHWYEFNYEMSRVMELPKTRGNV